MISKLYLANERQHSSSHSYLIQSVVKHTQDLIWLQHVPLPAILHHVRAGPDLGIALLSEHEVSSSARFSTLVVSTHTVNYSSQK